MRLATAPELMAAPIGRYYLGRCCLMWAGSESVAGSTLWGAPGLADVDELMAVWDFGATMPPHAYLADLRRVEVFDPQVFLRVVKHVRAQHVDDVLHCGRHAILIPRDAYLAATMAGIPAILEWKHDWRAFQESADALDWLSVADAPAMFAEVESLVGEATAADGVLHAVRTQLRQRPRTANLADLARAVGRSERSLQRDLAALGTSFRDELRHARVQAASAILRDPHAKLEAVAREVGYQSRSHFNRAYREVTGALPRADRSEK